MNKPVLIEHRDLISYLSLNRPDRKNSLTPELVNAMSEALDSLPESTRAVVIRGSGGAFCAGADLDWVRMGIEQDRETNIRESEDLVGLLERIKQLPVPVISYVEGPAIGAGAGIVIASDFRIIRNNAVFGFSEVKIGVVPVAIIDLVMGAFQASVAKELLLTGMRLSGSEAAEHGLSRHVFHTDDEGRDILSDVIDAIKATKPQAVSLTKKLIADAEQNSFPDKHKIAEYIADLRQSEEAKEGIRSFFAK